MTSAYFPDEKSSIEERDHPQQLRRDLRDSAPTTSPLFHFPLHRNVLWDRSHLHVLSKIVIQPQQVLPPLLLSTSTIREILMKCKHSSQFDQTLQILSFHEISAQDQYIAEHPLKTFTSSAYFLKFESQDPLRSKIGSEKWTTFTVPYTIQRHTHLAYDASSTQTLLTNLGKSIRLSSEFSFKSIVRSRCIGVLTSTSPYMSATLRFEIFIPMVSFQIVHLDLLPIQPTNLSKSLLERHGRLESFSSGYLTLTQIRKVVLLQESDLTVSSVPIVGVWISVPTNALSRPNLTTKILLSHPVIWGVCVRYLYAEKVRERVFVDANTFLMVNCDNYYFKCKRFR